MKKRKRLVDEYKYLGFRPLSTVKIHPDMPDARIITLNRRQKKQYADIVGRFITRSTTERYDLYETFHAAMHEYTLQLRSDV